MNRTFAFSFSLVLMIAQAAIAADAPKISHEIKQVPMRDGVKLATDVYRRPEITRAPVVLMRTPYNKARPLRNHLSGRNRKSLSRSELSVTDYFALSRMNAVP